MPIGGSSGRGQLGQAELGLDERQQPGSGRRGAETGEGAPQQPEVYRADHFGVGAGGVAERAGAQPNLAVGLVAGQLGVEPQLSKHAGHRPCGLLRVDLKRAVRPGGEFFACSSRAGQPPSAVTPGPPAEPRCRRHRAPAGFQARLVRGCAARALITESAGAALTMVGSRIRKGLRRVLVGRMSQMLIRSAYGPVAVIRSTS